MDRFSLTADVSLIAIQFANIGAETQPAAPDAAPEIDIEIRPEQDQQLWLEPPYRVIIHNDDVTTFDFVIRMLMSIFKLGQEIAEHIAILTHIDGIALVCVRPRSEAEKLVGQAIFAARIEGFPLVLSCEPDE